MQSPKVVIQTPTEKVIEQQKAGIEPFVTDSDGKVYKLRLPDPLDEFDLTAALGEDSTNVGLQSISIPILYIESIDNLPMTVPRKYNEVRASIKRIGRNGFKVVMEAIKRYMDLQQLDQKEGIEEIKK